MTGGAWHPSAVPRAGALLSANKGDSHKHMAGRTRVWPPGHAWELAFEGHSPDDMVQDALSFVNACLDRRCAPEDRVVHPWLGAFVIANRERMAIHGALVRLARVQRATEYGRIVVHTPLLPAWSRGTARGHRAPWWPRRIQTHSHARTVATASLHSCY